MYFNFVKDTLKNKIHHLKNVRQQSQLLCQCGVLILVFKKVDMI